MKKSITMAMCLIVLVAMVFVSCAGEEEIQKSDLVEVSLAMGQTRAINATDPFKTLTYKYMATPQFAAVGNAIVGETDDFVALPENMELGYLTQGLWKFEVKAYLDGTLAFTGETTCYVTKSTSTVTVFLAVDKTEEGTVEFKVKANALAGNTAGYSAKATIGGTPAGLTMKIIDDHWEMEGSAAVEPGYHLVTVEFSDADGVIGTAVTYATVLAGATTTISGEVSARDFQELGLEAIVFDPQITAIAITQNEDPVAAGSTITSSAASVIFTPTVAMNNPDEEKYTVEVEYTWVVNSTTNVLSAANTEVLTISAAALMGVKPGVANVTCYGKFTLKEGSSEKLVAYASKSVSVNVVLP